MRCVVSDILELSLNHVRPLVKEEIKFPSASLVMTGAFGNDFTFNETVSDTIEQPYIFV